MRPVLTLRLEEFFPMVDFVVKDKKKEDFEIMDPEGALYGLQGRSALGLCRCGHSANKPFCDGAHRNNFEHDSVAFDLPPMKTN